MLKIKNFSALDYFDADDLTTDVSTAIAIFPDGSMVDGCFCCGIRGNDHNMVIGCLDCDWQQAHDVYGVVRLVPETNVALIDVKQTLSRQQELLVKRGGYSVERY